MTALLITLNILAGLFLIGVVLLQSGKGADMGAAFGGASATVFGPSGAGNFLTKVTAATAATFMITSLLLAVLSARERSVFDGAAEPEVGAVAPVAPTPAAPVPGAGKPVEQAAVPGEVPAAGDIPALEEQTSKPAPIEEVPAPSALGDSPEAP